MEWLWAALPALACGAMMLLICVPMMMGRKHGHDDSSVSKEEVSALREELAQLRAQEQTDAGAEGSDNRELTR
ncbi:MAG: hypothetical protein ACRDLB_01235 [Actinomycetota bacterium]